MSQVVTGSNGKITDRERLRRKEEILRILARIADEKDNSIAGRESFGNPLSEYYIMTSEELGALTAGNMEKIEEWVGKMDSQRAARLMTILNQTQD
ncbi:MAG: hypothetical protein GX631_03470 [Dehalococcoidales bacterium]|nr:hypothetical protein [Dehalococcoidales bacterium]